MFWKQWWIVNRVSNKLLWKVVLVSLLLFFFWWPWSMELTIAVPIQITPIPPKMSQKLQSVFRCYWLQNRLTKTPVSSSYRRIRFSRHLLQVYGHWNPFTKQAIEKLNTLRTIVSISTGETKGNECGTVAQFAARLRQLAAPCDFLDDSVDSFISDQLTDNCLAKNLQTKLLVEWDLALDRALDIAQAMEAWESQSRQMAEDSQFAV